jgi:hypothetical protein
MFQILVINPNKYSDFTQSLWKEKEKVKEYIYSVDTNDLKESLNTVFNPDYTKEKLDLNTVDVLYTQEYTYQLVYGVESEDENYISSVINYKRKPIKGVCVLIKIKLTENNNDIQYIESPMSINDDINFIIKDLFFHVGYKINTSIEEIIYDNKYNIQEDNNKMKELSNYEVNLFGIPFKIWYVEDNTKSKIENTLSYVKDIGLFLNKNISDVYITCSVYAQCKCMSLNKDILKQFIDLITTFPDEGELKEITVAYNFVTKNHRSENVYIMFSDFYWKVMKENR